MAEMQSPQEKLLKTCDVFLVVWSFGEHAELIADGLDEVAHAGLRVVARFDAFADCYPERSVENVVGEQLARMKDACDDLRVIILGQASPPTWVECPVKQRHIYEGVLLCTMWADSIRRLGCLLQLKKGEGGRTKKLIQSMITALGSRLGLSYDKQAECLKTKFTEYSDVESLRTALRTAAKLKVDEKILPDMLDAFDAIERACQMFLPEGQAWFDWISSGFAVRRMKE